MKGVLLLVIYLAFISLGLPDSVTGSAWPVIHTELGISVSSAGLITMTIATGTIVSAFFSQRIIRRLGTARVTAVSIFMTAASLLGYSFSPSLFWILLSAIPLGLGAGCVDSALNHYVALHYSAGEMGYLHCFWGIGTLLSPLLLSYLFSKGISWRPAFRMNASLQLAIMLVVVLASPLFERNELSDGQKKQTAEESDRVYTLFQILKVKGALHSLLAFTAYCGFESTTFLWVASFAVYFRGFSPSVAALMTSMVYLGLTLGRLLTGFFSNRTSDRSILRLCHAVSLLAIISLFLQEREITALVSVFFLGLGFGPIFPTMLHQSVNYFDSCYSQAMISFQMVFAYIGSTFMPPLFGLLSRRLSLGFFPTFILALFIFHALQISLKNRCAGDRAFISNRESI